MPLTPNQVYPGLQSASGSEQAFAASLPLVTGSVSDRPRKHGTRRYQHSYPNPFIRMLVKHEVRQEVLANFIRSEALDIM